jgi:hypothetical protein
VARDPLWEACRSADLIPLEPRETPATEKLSEIKVGGGYWCEHCGTHFGRRDNLLRHKRERHGPADSGQQSKPTTYGGGLVCCQSCNKRVKDLKRHVKRGGCHAPSLEFALRVLQKSIPFDDLESASLLGQLRLRLLDHAS